MKKKSLFKPLVIVAGATAIASSLSLYVWREEHRQPLLEIYIFALDSGRSMFIRTPEDKRILVDGGSNSKIIGELTDILPFYSRRIDAIIATNTDGKNVSGLIDVIERYKVEKVYLPAFTLENLLLASSTDQIYETFLETLTRENISTEELQQGRTLYLDNKVKLKIIFPATPVGQNDLVVAADVSLTTKANFPKFSYSKTSAPEILFNILYDNNSVAFLGNATNKIQKYITTTTSLTSTNVLIVSHSALPANISQQLIEKIKPQNLIYSKRVTDKTVSDSNSSTNNSKNKNSKKKEVIDPLKYLKAENRFNLKEKGRIKIVGDGEVVRFVIGDK